MIETWGGIDPGLTGAIAFISESSSVDVFDYPGNPSGAAQIIKDWCMNHSIRMLVLERVSAMPKQGVSSVFKLGHNYGCWDGILSSLDVPYLVEPPRVWQKGLIRKTDGADPKSRSLTVARRLFPKAPLGLKKHHNRADALLMAYYARRSEPTRR